MALDRVLSDSWPVTKPSVSPRQAGSASPSARCARARTHGRLTAFPTPLLSRARDRLRLPPSSQSGVWDKAQGGWPSQVDHLSRAFWEQAFELRFLRSKGTAFQEFFCSIMELGHPGDFQRVRPWGSAGDRKNDGYLRSRRILFAVYGPNEMKAREAVAKIDSDCNGAVPHWREYFDSWVFVHNSRDGLGPDITRKLGELNAAHPFAILPWGFAELRLELFALPGADIAAILGPAPDMRTMQHVSMQDLQPLIDQLGRQPAMPEDDLRPVPPDKLSFNLLSPNVASLLRAGMTRSDVVAQYFIYHHDPTYRDGVAERFRLHYQELRSKSLAPDRIFDELRSFVGGPFLGTAEHDAAVLAILAYFFETCDVFERPLQVSG
jgi:hypothetical protein